LSFGELRVISAACSEDHAIDTVVFDLGGVLIDWNPRHLYSKLITCEAAVERFLAEVCTAEWNHQLDAGRAFDEGIAELIKKHPQEESLIRAWQDRWEEMLAGPIAGSVALLEMMHDRGLSLHAITNWSAETFPIARRRFKFLARFKTIVVSGEEGLAKPEAAIFDLLVNRTGAQPGRSIFIDDNPLNITAAAALGFHTIHFTDPEALREQLLDLRLIPSDQRALCGVQKSPGR
jgi:2-haloacid dehalogenase